MYESLKKIAKNILPKHFLTQQEDLLRTCISVAYVGKQHQCSICHFKMKKFIALNNADNLCPRCGSLSRSRRLYTLLKEELSLNPERVLHFSPPSCLVKALKKVLQGTYVTSDFAGEFTADKHYDITQISAPDHLYDVIICYHVLEHIEQDSKAMQELYRVLKPGGKCFIQTPFKDGSIYENPAIKTAEERLQHFGQADHVRIYSVEGLEKRLEKAGFKVTITPFYEKPNNYYGYKTQETVLIAQKP